MFHVFRAPCRHRLIATLICWMLVFAGTARAADDYLEPEQAFKFTATLTTPQMITVRYAIADGYYMYRERFHFKAEGGVLGTPAFPPGKVKFDDTFKKELETYRHVVEIQIPVQAKQGFTLTSTGQGCADAGLCYAPMDSEIRLGTGSGVLGAARAVMAQSSDNISEPVSSNSAPAGPDKSATAAPASENGRIQTALQGGRLLVIIPLFMLLGLGLSFTPCVLPMLPILSSIIAGEGAQVGRARGLALALAYASGMSIVYTLLGIAAGLAGAGLAPALQSPWVLSAFAILMIGLSLSMFGVYQLQVPAAMQQRLMQASDRQRAGKLFGVFVMGALSALIVGPCVAAPLAGALVYISQTRNVLVGGSALFALALGMSVPLLLIGVSAGALLPRTGVWMAEIKRFFGVLMLAVALWIVAPIVPAVVLLLSFGLLGIGYGATLLMRKQNGRLAYLLGAIFILLGAVEVLGAVTGARDPAEPLAHFSATPSAPTHFTRITNLAQLDAALGDNPGKRVMLDFYADWCVSCKEMEKMTFTDPEIRAKMAQMVLLQADVTANNADDKALLKRFGLFGPPGILFFVQGKEVASARVIGYQNSDHFMASLQRAAN